MRIIKIKTLLLVFSVFVVTIKSYSSLSISQLNNAKCPGVAFSYTVTNTVNTVCAYDWVVTNGTIQGGSQSGNTSTLLGAGEVITITWLNVTSGSISVTAKGSV